MALALGLLESMAAQSLYFILSDVHFGSIPGDGSNPVDMHRFEDSENSRRLSLKRIDELRRAMERTGSSSDDVVIVISGDLTYTAKQHEFKLVNAFLSETCGAVGIRPDQVVLVLVTTMSIGHLLSRIRPIVSTIFWRSRMNSTVKNCSAIDFRLSSGIST